jgi:DNA-binding MarR family transcriptional regulator
VSSKKTQRFRALLRGLVRSLGHEETESGCGCGLTFTQCHSLLEIGDRGSTTVAQLADSLSLDKSTLSRTVESLVTRGLVQRRVHTEDRRQKMLTLTAEGEALRREINARADKRFGGVLKGIPKESQEPMLKYLDVLVRGLNDRSQGT